MACFSISRQGLRPAEAGFLLPLSVTASLLLLLSSLSLQAAALQSRSQVSAGQRLRQAEDQLMSAAQHLAAAPLAVEELPARVGEAAQVGPVAYRLVKFEGPSWQDQLDARGLQRGQVVATLELLASAEQPRPLRAAFAFDLARGVIPEGQAPLQVVGLRELGLRGRSATEVAP